MIILIGAGVSLLTFFVFFWFFSNADNKQQKQLKAAEAAANKHFTISSKDIETISGDDVMTTQLDLARAYLETDRKKLAKSILNNVLQHGDTEQQHEAKRLLATLQMVS